MVGVGKGDVGIEVPRAGEAVEGRDGCRAVDGGDVAEVSREVVEPIGDVDGGADDGLSDEGVGGVDGDGVGEDVAFGGHELVDCLVGLGGDGAGVLQVHGGQVEII